MTRNEAGRTPRRKLRVPAVIVASATLAALGIISLYRQATSVRLECGFSVLDVAGTVDVDPAGAAEQAGLRTGDRLVTIDGAPFRSAFEWNRRILESASSRRVTVEALRGERMVTVQVPVTARPGGNPIYYYLALVGFFCLATATVATLRPGRTVLAWKYYAFCAAIFAVFSLSDTPAAGGVDWILFIADRIGRLTFAPLFLILVRSLTRSDGGRPWGRVAIWSTPVLLGVSGVAIQLGASRGVLRDPLLLWQIKDRIELLACVVYVTLGLLVLARAVQKESVSYKRYLLRWALWGSLIGLGPLTFLDLLPAALGSGPPEWAELFALTLVAIPLTLSIALFRFRPGDLELYLKRAITALSVFFLTVAVFEAVSVLLEKLGGVYLNLSEWVRAGLAAGVAAILYPEIKTMTHQAIDRLVYGGRYSFRRTLLSFGRELNSELDLEALVEKFQERTRETLDLASTLLLVRDDREGVLRPVRETGPVVPVESPLMQRIRGVSYLLLEDLLHAPGAEKLEGLRARGVHYLFPMKVEGEVRAVLATGPRRGGESLNSEDVELLVALCGHAAIALESARLVAALHGKVEEVESLRRYNENILESSRIGILVVDAEGVIQALNQALVDIYGAPREAAIGRTLGEVFPLPLVRRLARQDDAGKGSEGIYRYSLTDRRGRRIVINVSISRLAAGDRARAGYVMTFDDVTDQVRMEEQLLRQDRLASIGLLAAGVAHEVNTPLTGISSYTQMLLAELDPSDPRVEILKKMERQTFRAASIVHSLLNFTRDGAAGVEMIRVADLMDESLALFEPQLRGGKIRVEKRIEEGLPLLAGHRGKLQQVLLNLLLNARDAIHDEGTIRLEARRKGGRLALDVFDDGEGIAEEDLSKVFDPFFTTKPRGRGTGLGLSLSYTIVQEHKGEITVESRRGEGTLFTVDLPFEGRDAVHA